jgi:hypothetical protein
MTALVASLPNAFTLTLSGFHKIAAFFVAMADAMAEAHANARAAHQRYPFIEW